MSHQYKYSLKATGKLLVFTFCCSLFATQVSAQAPWQKINMPTVAELSGKLLNPPSQYSAAVTWGWDGSMTREVIARDLDKFHEIGFRAVSIEAGYGMAGKYLSEAWFQSIKMAVEEAKKRGMHIWIIDEGKYPSGFAGGKFSELKPELKMQALTSQRFVWGSLTIGEPLNGTALSAIAYNPETKVTQNVAIKGGKIDFVPPPGKWEIIIAQSQFKTSPTRSANNPTKGKDGSASLMDYLNPEATRQFLNWTEEEYKKYIGDEFGKTVLGFRGDEPAFSYTPWTPKLPEVFKAKKGYDITPYLATFFLRDPSPEQQKAKADFYDVWSDMFGENYFKLQGDWCKANGMEYMVHLDKDDNMAQFVRSGGDFFKDLKGVQIPGVDAIWHQIWSDTVSNFSKFASSVSHVYNKPRALSESFAAYRPAPNVEQAKWVLNQQMVRGINLFELMFVSSSARSGQTNLRGYMGEAAFPALIKYLNTVCYVLSQGRPATQVALYMPTTSLWMGDKAANESLIKVGEELLNNQYDFDFVSEEALTKDLTVTNGPFTTASGTKYSILVIPSVTVLSNAVIEKIKTMTTYGGRVLFVGKTPELLNDKSFMDAQKVSPDMFSLIHSDMSGKDDYRSMFSKYIKYSDVSLATANPALKYIHRVIKDADIYFFFNESLTDEVNTTATLRGVGMVNEWDPKTNIVTQQSGTDTNYNTPVTLKLKPQETKFIIISKTKMPPIDTN
ncbi:hypothetical protein KXQ82_05355 [Mucilaginibacter sp. HMF5004]|uniref:glycosyl hydrolase n=1 Tax=Mucilaginibacter rivuli TaxID=2857527 RepID=UPI001C5F98A7|nr:glycosyl hydrolase [Mucilaginibacter rivuli]MBW4889129.1 hypothetical protein [Mucilaginibacter rivuli]